MEETWGLLLNFSLKFVCSWGLISFLLLSPLLVLHRVGKECRQREVSSLENATGGIAHFQAAWIFIFENYLQDWTILYLQGTCVIETCKRKNTVVQQIQKVILGPCPSYCLWSSALIIFHDRADHWAFRILKLQGNQISWTTISLKNKDFLHSHTICELSTTILSFLCD